jgi:hypothetical protein
MIWRDAAQTHGCSAYQRVVSDSVA